MRVKRTQRGQITWACRPRRQSRAACDRHRRGQARSARALRRRPRLRRDRRRTSDRSQDPPLWGYATSDGVGSGRELARLVALHAAYRWLCGCGAVAYRRLNDFRSDHGDVFSELVTQLLARLMKNDLIDLHRVAQDGARIRASAGAASFRSGETLERLMLFARAHLVEVTRAATDLARTARPLKHSRCRQSRYESSASPHGRSVRSDGSLAILLRSKMVEATILVGASQ